MQSLHAKTGTQRKSDWRLTRPTMKVTEMSKNTLSVGNGSLKTNLDEEGDCKSDPHICSLITAMNSSMVESETIYKMENDDELGKMKSTPSPSSRSDTSTSTVKAKRARLTFPFGPCRVCSDSATGIHYGIATCEGCKGFFKRSILRKEKYRCYFDNLCLINVSNRNRCKACRFRRCLGEGMSVDGVKMGRIPKLVKERALRELKEQQMRQEAALTENIERPDARESSCSSLSDRSIENYDPDVMETDVRNFQTSPIPRHGDSRKSSSHAQFPSDKSVLHHDRMINYQANLSEHDVNSDQRKVPPTVYGSRSSNYLPIDFTLDETDGLTEHSTGPLSKETFEHLHTVAKKLSQKNGNVFIQLTENEATFTRFLRWSSFNVYLRHSTRVKQLEVRMNQLVHEGIEDFPSDNATVAHFLGTVPKTIEVFVRSSVFYIQELPGMTNMDSSSLHKLLLHRQFDLFMLKYRSLLNKNGQSYHLSADGFPITRRWMDVFYGVELADAMFYFSQCLRELNLDDREIALVLPLQMCHFDSAMEDQETVRLLRSCYLYALYEELSYNRGEQEGRIVCSKILRVLDLLAPLNELYEKNVGSRVLEV